MRTGLIFDIKRYSVHDGPGIRTTVFFKGCPLSCWWCHNPESRDAGPTLYYDAEKCLGCHDCVAACPEAAVSPLPGASATDAERCTTQGACASACPSEARRIVGETYTVAALMAQVEKDRVFYEESGGGVTFSGGEPLLQWEFLLDVLRECGARAIHRAVDTTGATSPEVLRRVAEETDLFLYDLKTLDPELHERTTGFQLAPLLDNLRVLLDAGAKVRIRVPLIPGVSDGPAMDRTGDFLRDIEGIEGIEGVHLLPYHEPAREKHLRFGIPWHLPEDIEMPPEQVAALADRMRRCGLPVTIGG